MSDSSKSAAEGELDFSLPGESLKNRLPQQVGVEFPVLEV
jgi:hypothetical protein